MKKSNDTYKNLYNTDLKHLNRNLSRFIKEKSRASKAARNIK